jgi:hypothetical protein
MNYFIINQEDLQKLIDYLFEKPFKEANKLIGIITTLQKVNLVAPPAPATPTDAAGLKLVPPTEAAQPQQAGAAAAETPTTPAAATTAAIPTPWNATGGVPGTQPS